MTNEPSHGLDHIHHFDNDVQGDLPRAFNDDWLWRKRHAVVVVVVIIVAVVVNQVWRGKEPV